MRLGATAAGFGDANGADRKPTRGTAVGVMSTEDMGDNATVLKNRLKAARLARKRQSDPLAIPHEQGGSA